MVKGIKLCVSRTKQLNIGGINLTNVQYANIGWQVKFIYTIKYYQQLVSSPAKSADETKKSCIRNYCLKFIENFLTYSSAFANLPDENKQWILDYLAGGKDVIPHEKIKLHEDLNSVSENEFFPLSEFHSSLKNEIISDGNYENVKKIWQLLRLTKLSDLNDINNFQDIIIFCEIFENRVTEMVKKFPYNPRKCSSGSLLSSCIQRFLSQVIISLAT